MKSFFVYQEGHDGLKAVKGKIEDFLADIKPICSPTLFDEIKLGLGVIDNQIGSFTIKIKQKIRLDNTPRIIPTICPELIPLFISFDTMDREINGETKTILTFSAYLDMEVAGNTTHLDEYTKTLTLESNVSTQEKIKINRYAQRPDDPILISYRTIIFRNEDRILIPFTFNHNGPYFFSAPYGNSQQELDGKAHLYGARRPLQITINPATFFDIPKEDRMRKTPDFIYTGTERRVAPCLEVTTNLLVAYLILQKTDIQKPYSWRKSMLDINQLRIPNTLKIKLFDRVIYNLS